MIEGSCHCSRVMWRFDGVPDSATACNCTVCRRYGALWAYAYLGEGATVDGETAAYTRGDHEIGFHFCSNCGCITHWLALEPNEQGRLGVAVNLRLAEPDAVSAIPIRHFDGLDRFETLPGDGRCVVDLWF